MCTLTTRQISHFYWHPRLAAGAYVISFTCIEPRHPGNVNFSRLIVENNTVLQPNGSWYSFKLLVKKNTVKKKKKSYFVTNLLNDISFYSFFWLRCRLPVWRASTYIILYTYYVAFIIFYLSVWSTVRIVLFYSNIYFTE